MKARWRNFIVSLFLIVFLAQSSYADQSDMKMVEYKAPDNYFQLSIPKGWSCISKDFFGEKDYIFTPTPITREQLSNEFHIEASFIFKIIRLADSQLSTPVKNLMQKAIDIEVNAYRNAGVELNGQLGQPLKLMGLDGYTATFSGSKSELDFMFLSVKDNLAYVIRYQCNAGKVEQYTQVFKEMQESIVLNQYSCDEELLEFKDSANLFSIKLPKSWFAKEERTNDVEEFFISREMLNKNSDMFLTGVTMIRITEASRKLNTLESDDEIVKKWGRAALYPNDKVKVELFKFERVVVDNKNGILVERSTKLNISDYFVQEFHLIVAKDNILYDVIFEAPVMEFEKYRLTFLKSIESIKLN